MGALAAAGFMIVPRHVLGGPGRNIKLLWDNQNMPLTNFDEVNQFVKQEYRAGWSLQAHKGESS